MTSTVSSTFCLSRLARLMVPILKSRASAGFTSRRGTISPEVASSLEDQLTQE